MDLSLSTVIGKHFLVGNATIKLMTEFILALIKVRDVNLTSIALVICGQSKPESAYRKLQRFFAKVDICYVCLAKLIVSLSGITNAKWVLVLDRTNWKFGQFNINILVLSIDCFGIGIPILWSMLDNNGGSSNSLQRMDLLNRFIAIFGVNIIEGLLGDREFIGDNWLKFLAENGISFYIRIKSNLTIGRSEGELVTANHLVKNLKNSEFIALKGLRYLGKSYLGPKVKIAAMRNDKGELMVIATNDDVNNAIKIYAKRWSIENLFGCLKTRGFNFENTHIVHLDRIEKLLALLAITFTICHVLGIWRNEIEPIKIKPHKRKAKSLFRYGLDFLRNLLFHSQLMEAKLEEITQKLLPPKPYEIKELGLC
jgi:hypothetical protein